MAATPDARTFAVFAIAGSAGADLASPAMVDDRPSHPHESSRFWLRPRRQALPPASWFAAHGRALAAALLMGGGSAACGTSAGRSGWSDAVCGSSGC